MSTNANTTVHNRNSLGRSIAVAALILGTLDLIDIVVFAGLATQTPPILVLQYYASGALGNAAFAGGLATALLGLVFHYGVSCVVAAVFILSANQLPVLRRNAILGGLLYGAAVFVVMNFLVLPLSAAPKLPFDVIALIQGIVAHVLLVGLPLGMIVRRNANVSE
jgi:hypothetical protein